MNDIVSLLKESDNICIMPHVSADGDAIGSSLALGLTLIKLNKTVTVLTEEKTPLIYDFLSGKQLIEVINQDVKNFDTVLALDTGDVDRLGSRHEVFKNAKISVNIDHHPTNTMFADYNYVQTNAAAVGEIIYQLIKQLGIELDNQISTCLYVALATDTGGFRFGNTTPVTHQITADLINNGANVAEISQKIFDTTSMEKVKLTGLAINSLKLIEGGKIAFITLTDEMMKQAGAKEEECDGIVNIGRNIDGVEVSVLFRQRAGSGIKVNFRSKSYVDVSMIANIYSGGGHKRAAGCTIEGDLPEVQKDVLSRIIKVL
jgi:phosphoesterase RecJ-like protein